MPPYQQHPSSFRDPSGFVFEASGRLYRQVNKVYAEQYELLMRSGLYKLLTEKQWLIAHAETSHPFTKSEEHYKTIIPEYIPFISYPYEWCFEQLQDAALLTIDIMKAAMDHGMILKDATPYNIQFRFARPVHIDTLSFQQHDETKPWVAYRQFCETFLYPLLVSSYTGIEIHKLFAACPEGMDAQTTSALLPSKAKFNLGNWLHVFLAAKVKGGEHQKQVQFNKTKLIRIVDHLRSRVKAIQPSHRNRQGWKEYYDEGILNKEYLSNKQKIVTAMLEKIEAGTACDLGCNRGIFSRLLAKKIPLVIAADEDEVSVSGVYHDAQKNQENILPLCVDLANPPGDGGFNNQERKGFVKRMNYDVTLALALVHHLCVGKNIPLESIANFLSSFTRKLIIEFIPAEDEKAQQLLSRKEIVFSGYTQDAFELFFARHFIIAEKVVVAPSKRTIYLMSHKSHQNQNG